MVEDRRYIESVDVGARDPYAPEVLFWDQEDFGPTVTAEERAERRRCAVLALRAWDACRAGVLRHPLILPNEVCGMFVLAFAIATKLAFEDAMRLMAETIERERTLHRTAEALLLDWFEATFTRPPSPLHAAGVESDG